MVDYAAQYCITIIGRALGDLQSHRRRLLALHSPICSELYLYCMYLCRIGAISSPLKISRHPHCDKDSS